MPRFFEGSSHTNEPEDQVTRHSIPESCIYQNSHFGYVYCLLLGKVPNVEGEILFSGSGEGDIKVRRHLLARYPHLCLLHPCSILTFYYLPTIDQLWKLHKGRSIELWKTLKAGVDASTLTLALHDGFLFCGSQGGNIKAGSTSSLPSSSEGIRFHGG